MTTTSPAKPRSRRKPDAPPPITEREVMDQCIEGAAMLGITLRRQNTGMAMNPKGQAVRFGQPGAGDLRGELPDGRAIECECKAPGKVPTEKQWNRIEELNNTGAVGLWTDQSDWLVKVLRLVLDGAAVEYPDRTDHCVVMPKTIGGTTP